jgi:hypothetical protein
MVCSLYLFIYLLLLIPLIEYAQRKRNQIIPKTLYINTSIIIIIDLIQILGLYSLVPE